jgi:hypothetical protein
MHRIGSFRSGAKRGQTLVEFALTVPILLVLTIGLFDIGQAVYYYNALADCAREGARFGIVLSDRYWETGVYGHDPWQEPGNVPFVTYTANSYLGSTTIVGRAAAQGITLDKSQMTVYIEARPTQEGMHLPLRVEVRYPYRPLFFHLFGGATITLRGASEMIMQ